MGLELYFEAVRKDGSRSDQSVCLYNSRAFGVGGDILRYFQNFIMPVYDEYDTGREYPKYRIAYRAWDKLMSAIVDKGPEIDYLTEFVSCAFDFDEFVPEEYHDLSDIDMRAVIRFDRWYASMFHCTGVFEARDGVISLDCENCREVINCAYGLACWYGFDQKVREYLMDDEYEVYMGIG